MRHQFLIHPIDWRAYYELCKPRVVALMLVTAFVGMLLAVPIGSSIPWITVVIASVGIGLCACAGAVFNQLIDRRVDAIMHRTQGRPLPTGQVSVTHAVSFALILAVLGGWVLWFGVNTLTAWLTILAMMGYGVIYTVFLKRATSQNIVIGGLAGAMPPLLGWTAVAGQVDALPLLLALIIFIWTPPHFWALAIARYDEYKKVNIPMLPVTHGIPFTKKAIILYVVLLLAVTLLPFAIGRAGTLYALSALTLGLLFLYFAFRLCKDSRRAASMQVFGYSIVYLFLLFILLLADRYLPPFFHLIPPLPPSY